MQSYPYQKELLHIDVEGVHERIHDLCNDGILSGILLLEASVKSFTDEGG